MNDPQARFWSEAAPHYEEEFVDPFLADVNNPLPSILESLSDPERAVADLGCGIGPLLPQLSRCFGKVLAVDFSEGMLKRAREAGPVLSNISFHCCSFLQLDRLGEKVDLAVAVNSLVLADALQRQEALRQIYQMLNPGGIFLGIVPAIDAVHYHTLLLIDLARQEGLSQPEAEARAASQAEHSYYDFATGTFRYQGLEQHFWQPFEIPYCLRRVGFRNIRRQRIRLSWTQFAGGRHLSGLPAPWDWFFQARKPRT